MDRRKFILLTGAALLAASAIFIFSSRSDEGEKPGPEGVVTEFVSAMKTGDFDKAYGLCDTSSMSDHLKAYAQMWEEKSQQDSAAFSAINEILAGTQVHIQSMAEADGTCVVEYMLEMEGARKESSATLRLEEGEWKIVEITSKL